MFLDREYDPPIEHDGPLGGSNFGTMDFGPQSEKVPDWVELDEDEFLTPGAIKQGEDEESDGLFLVDTPQDAFTDRATREVIEFDPDKNPTFLVGREYLLSDRSDLIRDSATLMQDTFNSLRPTIFSRQPNLSRMVTEEVQPDGHLLKGEVIWAVEISAGNQPGVHRTQQSTPIRKTRINVPVKVREGRLEKPRIFYTASNKPYPLTVAGYQLVLKWQERPIVIKKAPQVELAQMPERDYRAF
jgi:hypothetical protein